MAMAKKKKHISTGTPALVLLEKTNTAHTVHPYEHDPNSDLSYGLEAAQAIGVDPTQVFKTLMAQVDGDLVVAIVPVNRKLDLKALAAAVGGKKGRHGRSRCCSASHRICCGRDFSTRPKDGSPHGGRQQRTGI